MLIEQPVEPRLTESLAHLAVAAKYALEHVRLLEIVFLPTVCPKRKGTQHDLNLQFFYKVSRDFLEEL